MNILRKLRDWAIGPGGWLADENLDAQLSAVDIELDQLDTETRRARDVAWIEQAATQNPNHRVGDIHVVHSGDIGWNYWFQTPNGLLTAGTGFLTEGRAWRAALLELEQQAIIFAGDDYPN